MPDPAGPQAFNRYSYCLNNPLRYVDPSGHQIEEIIGVAGGLIVTAGLLYMTAELMSITNPQFASSVQHMADSLYNAGTGILSQTGSAIKGQARAWSNGMVQMYNDIRDDIGGIFNSPPPHPLQGEGRISVVETFPGSMGTIETTIVDKSWDSGSMTLEHYNVMRYPDGTRELTGALTFPGSTVDIPNTMTSNRISPNQLNEQIKKGLAPNGVERVDVGRIPGEQTHVHLDNGSALNVDGTWKHGESELTNTQKEWLEDAGFVLPGE